MSYQYLQFKPDQDPVGICNRCKSKQGIYICSQCSPFNLFCKECDASVHSYPSKVNHKRDKLNNSSQTPSELNSEINETQNIKTYFTTSNIINSPNKYSNEIPKQTELNKIGTVSENYIQEIEKIYEDQKEQLINKNYLLQKNMTNNAQNYENRIGALEQQLKEETEKNGMNVKVLLENHEDELKKVVMEKDAQINYLYNLNFELEKKNKELMSKIEEYADLFNHNKISYSEKLSTCEKTIDSLNKDCEELKKFYEKKLTFFSQNFSNEKNKIINGYESALGKLNEGYSESKNKYLSIIHQRDEEIKSINDNHNLEINSLNQRISDLMDEINNLREDNERLMRNKNEMEGELSNLTNLLQRCKADLNSSIKENNRLNQDLTNLKRENEDLVKINDKYELLTHGKLKKTLNTSIRGKETK